MSIERESFGKMPDGEEVELFTLTNRNGLRAKIMTYGATLTAVETPDREGRLTNVTLALDSLADYLRGHPCLGSTIGRYANRIALGRFQLDGTEYRLATNNGPNHLHGGTRGFDKVVWKPQPAERPGRSGVAFSYQSADGEEGYPGRLLAQVTYALTDDNELRIEYAATCEKPTVVNLTNHTYWNLGGAGSGDVLGHRLTLAADHYLPVDAGLIPTGQIKPVNGTPMDFTQSRTIGSRIQQTGYGYDHCFVVKREPGQQGLTLAARVEEPHSGRVMDVYTTQPGIQLYTANFLDATLHGGPVAFGRHFGLCLETQHYPDSPNRPEFPSTVLRPGEVYEQVTMHKFGV